MPVHGVPTFPGVQADRWRGAEGGGVRAQAWPSWCRPRALTCWASIVTLGNGSQNPCLASLLAALWKLGSMVDGMKDCLCLLHHKFYED